MAYISGVLVERSQQSMRPREPAPPGRSLTVASRMMSTRMLRPRENNAINGYVSGLGATARQAAVVQHVTAKAAADRYLALIASHRGQQRYLEDLLKQIGAEMQRTQQTIKTLSLSKTSANALRVAGAKLLQLQKDAMACINAIKACAAKANAAAAAAVENGATPTEVQQANTSAGTSSGSANITRDADTTRAGRVAAAQTSLTTTTRPAPIDTVTADVAPVVTVVESNNPSVAPDGTLVPGGDAKVVQTPATTESGAAVAKPSSGGLLTVGNVFIAFGIYYGVRWLNKHV